MKLFQSIRFRIVLACITFSVIVTLCYGWVTFYGVKYNSDELFNWYIAQEAGELIALYQQDPDIDLSAMTTASVLIADEGAVLSELTHYFPGESTKALLREAASLEKVKLPGPRFSTEQGYIIYEFIAEGKTVHVLKAVVNETQKEQFYYIVDVSDFINYDNLSEEYIADIFIRILLVILLLALFVGVFLAKMVLSPLTRLANSVDSVDHNQYSKYKETYFDDEIGFLAKKIDSFVSRTNEFVIREKAFSRDASHELRTPVASSRAALELAMSAPEGQSPTMDKYLQRIHRANRDMTHLIETFLLLGKEEKESMSHSKFNLFSLIDKAFDKHNYLKKSADVECINDVDIRVELKAPEQLLSIVINNLIRNAFQHTTQGAISVHYQEGKLVVKDSGEGIKHDDNQGLEVDVLDKSGVGLSLVKRLSDKQGWQVEITSIEGEGTCVSVDLTGTNIHSDAL